MGLTEGTLFQNLFLLLKLLVINSGLLVLLIFADQVIHVALSLHKTVRKTHQMPSSNYDTLSLEGPSKNSKGRALNEYNKLTTTNLSKFHLIHALSSIPMEKSLTTEHGCELLRHTLEQFLSHRVYDYKLQGMCKTAHTTYVIVISQPIHNYRMLSVSANYC